MGSGRAKEGGRKQEREGLIDCKELAFRIVGTEIHRAGQQAGNFQVGAEAAFFLL